VSTPGVENQPPSRRVFARAFTPQQFLEWINYRRERETLTAIARSLGVSVNAICRWCDGVRRPSRPILLLGAYVWVHGSCPSSGQPRR
jgi:hypothetical protein